MENENCVMTPSQVRRRKLFMYAYELIFGASWACIAYSVLLMRNGGLSSTEIGTILSLQSVLAAFAPMLWGMIADKLRSKKKVYILVLILAGIASALVPPSVKLKVFGMVLVALTIPLANFFRMPSNSLLDSMLVAEAKRIPGSDYSSIRVWASIGYSVATISYSLLDKYVIPISADIPFYMFSVLTIIVIFMTKGLHDVKPMVEDGRKSIPFRELKPGRLFGNYYVIMFVLTAIMFSMSSGTLSYISDLITAIGGNPNDIGLISGVKTIAEIAMLFLCPLLKKKFSITTLFCAGGLLYGIELLSYASCTSTLQVLLVECLNGAGLGLILGNAINYMAVLAPKGLEATAMALYGSVGSIAGIITNQFAAKMLDAIGIFKFYTVFGYLVAFAVAFFILSFVFGEKVLKKPAPVPLGFVRADSRDASKED